MWGLQHRKMIEQEEAMQIWHDKQNPLESIKNKRDPVNHPSHYQGKKFEVIDIIEDFNLNFNLGNAIKYILRSKLKGNTVQDLKKAIWYLEREVKE